MTTTLRPLLTQLELFRPPPARPAWRSLPPEVRSRAQELLVQLLREHHRIHAALRGKEAGDE